MVDESNKQTECLQIRLLNIYLSCVLVNKTMLLLYLFECFVLA